MKTIKDIWETARNLAEVTIILMHQRTPFPDGLFRQDEKGYTKEAQKSFDELLVHFKEVLEESTI